MDFRTVIKPAPATVRVDHSSGIVMLGSCFSDNIGRRLLDGLFDVDVNPMGTLYNPASIASALDDIMARREFAAAELFEHDGRWHSFAHHSRFSGTDPEKVLRGINSRLRTAHDNLRRAGVLIVTFGTAWIFTLRATGRVVSNCHKLPSAMFIRSRMSVDDIVALWQPLLARLREFNPSLQVIFTVSPIRHLADGAHGNQLSKATLLLAVDSLIGRDAACSVRESASQPTSFATPSEVVCPDGSVLLIDPVPPMAVEYFPAYEALMDDLRDYRFYAADMTHPSETAVDYVYSLFAESHMSEATRDLATACRKVTRRLAHRPMTDDPAAIERFGQSTRQLVEALSLSHPYLKKAITNYNHLTKCFTQSPA
ncbi:MAG: GSCFA domain-containing protein [Muribaculaceae bacterium]